MARSVLLLAGGPALAACLCAAAAAAPAQKPQPSAAPRLLPPSAPGAGEELPPPDELLAALRRAGGRDLARYLAHRGVAGRLDLDTARAHLATTGDPMVLPLVAAALLAPSWVAGAPPLTGEARREAVGLGLHAVLHLPNDEDLTLVTLRILPWLRDEDLEAVRGFLHRREAGNRRRALGILAAGPWTRTRPVLLAAVRDPALAEAERAFLASRWIEAEGRDALDGMADLLQPSTPPLLLRRLLILLRPWVLPADRSWLRPLAREAAPAAAAAALELWARVEDEGRRREEIFQAALTLEPERRDRVLDALAIRGGHPGIGRRLVNLLRSPERDERRLARRLLPRFASPDQVLAAWRGLPAALRLEDQTAWMQVLVRLPLAEARTEALQWLVEGGGWSQPGAREVAAALRDEPAVDALLPDFLRREEVPEDVRLALAMGRAAASEAARDWLRGRLDAARGPRWERVVRALAGAGDPRDLYLLLDLARDPALAPPARAAAVAGLGEAAGGVAGLLDLAGDPPAEYEVLEALIREMIRCREPGVRRRGLGLAAAGGGLEDPDARAALRRAAWQEQVEHPRADEAPELAGELAELLTAAAAGPAEDPATPLPRNRHLARDWPDVDACAQALAAALASEGGDEARAAARRSLLELRFPAGHLPRGPLVLAAGHLAPRAPEAVQAWMGAVLALPHLEGGARIRALAILHRAAMEGEALAAAVGALDRLLARPRDLVRYAWELDRGLEDPAARTWTLVLDRLAERRLVLLARQVAPAARAQLLAPLEEGLASPEALLEAVRLLLEREGAADRTLALRLARRAAERGPGREDVRAALVAAGGSTGGGSR